MTAHLARISLYPIKSLDGCQRDIATIIDQGALKYDRHWAMFTPDGRVFNGKRSASVHRLRATYDAECESVAFEHSNVPGVHQFALDGDKHDVNGYLSQCMGQPVELREAEGCGFVDDLEASGPTVISTATLLEVASWFNDLTLEDARRRFRANLEIDGVPAFWEECLYGAHGHTVEFDIGAVRLFGSNPCQRCVVPSRDPRTAEPIPGFAQRFVERRQATLPRWAEVSRFDHFYRLAVNTKADSASEGLQLRVGDEVRCDVSPAT